MSQKLENMNETLRRIDLYNPEGKSALEVGANLLVVSQQHATELVTVLTLAFLRPNPTDGKRAIFVPLATTRTALGQTAIELTAGYFKKFIADLTEHSYTTAVLSVDGDRALVVLSEYIDGDVRLVYFAADRDGDNAILLAITDDVNEAIESIEK